jgi:hypothetical protein
MADIGHELMIKYGLSRAATRDEQQRWAEATQNLIRQGVAANEAGERAAALILPGYNTHFYASEADAIEMLLRRASDK